jgi:hypothetical protein
LTTATDSLGRGDSHEYAVHIAPVPFRSIRFHLGAWRDVMTHDMSSDTLATCPPQGEKSTPNTASKCARRTAKTRWVVP